MRPESKSEHWAFPGSSRNIQAFRTWVAEPNRRSAPWRLIVALRSRPNGGFALRAAIESPQGEILRHLLEHPAEQEHAGPIYLAVAETLDELRFVGVRKLSLWLDDPAAIEALRRRRPPTPDAFDHGVPYGGDPARWRCIVLLSAYYSATISLLSSPSRIQEEP